MNVSILRFDRHNQQEPHILPVGPRVALEITRGRVQQRIRPVRRAVFLIGTANDCDLVLGDVDVVREAYAYLFVHEAKVMVRSLGAGPPLTVCGEPTDSAELLHGDVVAFGPFELRVLFDQPVPAGPSPSPAAVLSVLRQGVDSRFIPFFSLIPSPASERAACRKRFTPW